jgi:hypothetical protein
VAGVNAEATTARDAEQWLRGLGYMLAADAVAALLAEAATLREALRVADLLAYELNAHGLSDHADGDECRAGEVLSLWRNALAALASSAQEPAP